MSRRKGYKYEFSVEEIAKIAAEQFLYVWQDLRLNTIDPGGANRNLERAKMLLETLEIRFCGQIGGYDLVGRVAQSHSKNPRYRTVGFEPTPFQRLTWIWDHYTNLDDRTEISYATYGDLVEFFTEIKVY